MQMMTAIGNAQFPIMVRVFAVQEEGSFVSTIQVTFSSMKFSNGVLGAKCLYWSKFKYCSLLRYCPKKVLPDGATVSFFYDRMEMYGSPVFDLNYK